MKRILVFIVIVSIVIYANCAFVFSKSAWMRPIATACVASAVTLATVTPAPLVAQASTQSVDEDIERLNKGLTGLNVLLNNWQEKTTYCNFGELDRKILAPENKAELKRAAAECGLLDYACQSKTMNVKCKRDPQVVRAFLGLEPDTGNVLLYRSDTVLKSKKVLERVDPDGFDQYLDSVEKYQEAVAAADSLAYAARTDYGSTENRSLAETKANSAGIRDGKEDFLQQSKAQVEKARDELAKCLDVLAAAQAE